MSLVRIFFGVKGANPWTVLACLIVASLVEGIGLASLLPLVTVATGSMDSDTSPLSQIVLDSLQAIGLTPEFRVLVAVLIGTMVVKAVMTLFAMRYVGHAFANITTRLRRDVIASILRVRWEYFVSQPVGRLINAVSSEAVRAGKAFHVAATLLADAIQTVAYLAVAILLSWELTLVALLFGGVMLILLSRLVRMSRRAGQKQNLRTRQLLQILTDVLNNIKPLKAMAKQLTFERYIDQTLVKLRRALQKEATSGAALKGFQEILIALCSGAGLIVAVEIWNVPLAQLLVMYVVISKVVRNLARLQSRYQAWAAAEAPFNAIKEIVAETQRAAESFHGGKTPVLSRACDIRKLSFSYGDKNVLHDVNLEIPANAITVVMGVSGAGKSTLTDLLLGFYDPQEGEILVDGIPLEDLDIAEWRGMIGYVPQDLALFHDTILLNITLGDETMTEKQVEDALRAAGAWDFVSALPAGLRTVVGEKGLKLSGGQRQRIALARALAIEPKLLILDEVTSALDTATEREICRTLCELRTNTAILAITHRPQFLEFADQAYRLQDGLAEEIDGDARLVV